MPPLPNTRTRELTHIEHLITTGEFNEARQALERFEQRDDLLTKDRLNCHLLKSKLMNKLWYFEEGLKLAQIVFNESKRQQMSSLMVDALLAMAEALCFTERYDEGLDLLKQCEQELILLEQDQPTEISLRKAALLHQKGLIYHRKRDGGLSLVYSQEYLVLFEKNAHKVHVAEALNNISNLYCDKDDFEQVLQYYRQNVALHEKFRHKLEITGALSNLGNIYFDKGHVDLALECYQQSMALREELGDKSGIANSLNMIGRIYFGKGDLDLALEYAQQSLALSAELGHKPLIAEALDTIGDIYRSKGDLDLALIHFEQGLALVTELGHKHNIALFLVIIAYIYRRKGELDRALECAQQSLTLGMELEQKEAIAWSFAMISYIYHQKGELDHALRYAQHGLTLVEELGYKGAIAFSLDSIGWVYRQKGELDQALRYHQRSLKLRKDVGDNSDTALTLFHLVSVTIAKDALDQARQYLQQLQELNEREKNKVISQRCRVAEALLLKTSTRARNRGRAEELLVQVAEEEIFDHELTVVTLLSLCDLLLIELRSFDNPEVLDEVHAYMTRLQEIATQQGSHWLLAETYVLQSKLALVELDVNGARRSLEQAQRLAEEHGLQRLAMQISTEHDSLLEQLSSWEDLIDRDASMEERFELARLEDLLVLMLRKQIEATSELPEEEPQLLLIIETERGHSVFSKSFRPDQPFEEQLIAGFLTAINAFIREAFAAAGSIERVKHQEHTILLKAIEPFLVCYVVKGPTYFAIKKLDQFTEALQMSPAVWQVLTDASQEGRLITEEKKMNELIMEIFRAPAE